MDAANRERSGVRRFALFDYGFRPFFLSAGLYALVSIALWLWIYTQGGAPLPRLPSYFWHAHEMIYGFVAAAIAGFLLTAVPSWTGARGFGGPPLVVLAVLWAVGRAALASAASVPMWLVTLLELSFLPVLAAMLAPPLLRAQNRNTPMLLVLGVLWLVDVAFMIAANRGDALLAQRALRLAVDFVLILVTIIGGRIVPAFTASALRARGATAQVVARPWLEPLVIALMVAIAIVDAIRPDSLVSGLLAAAAAAAHALRLSGWLGLKTLREPVVWALHIAYAWLPVGLALKALWLLGGLSWATHWVHAFTTGVFSTMILAVMTRASLGHTGRPLVVSRPVAVAYLVLTAAAAVRVFGPGIAAFQYRSTVVVAGALWSVAFALYLFVYAPILCAPRVDGKPG